MLQRALAHHTTTNPGTLYCTITALGIILAAALLENVLPGGRGQWRPASAALAWAFGRASQGARSASFSSLVGPRDDTQEEEEETERLVYAAG